MKIGKNIAFTIVCIILGIMLSWQFKSIDSNREIIKLENKRASELMDDLLSEKRIREDLEKKLNKLETELKSYQDVKGRIDGESSYLEKQLNDAKLFAGLENVKGEGIIVTIESDILVIDEDILSIINELRASDAQAISVNDERIIATSEVRRAGKYIMINGRQVHSPYVIKAIVDPHKAEQALKMSGGVMDQLELFKLEVTIEKSDNIVIPKIDLDDLESKTDLLTVVD